MRLLLDTLVLILAAGAPDRLSPAARTALESDDNQLYWSAVSTAEIAIKTSSGKLTAGAGPLDLVTRYRSRYGLAALPLTDLHAAEVGTLPYHHRDPFDRLLIAQARCERLAIVTSDAAFRRYDVAVVW